MRGTRKLADRPDVAAATTDHIATTIAAIEIAAPHTAPAPRPAKTTTPLHQVQDGRGAWVWKKTGPHEAEVVWDPSAPAVVATPLPLGSDLRGLMQILARRHQINAQAFTAWCSENTAAVRAASRSYRDNGGQLVDLEVLVLAFKEPRG